VTGALDPLQSAGLLLSRFQETGHTLLLLLIAGHLLGDFALQTRRIAEGKRRGGMFAAHLGLVALAHLIAVAPLLSWPLAGLVLAITISHGVIDLVTVRRRRGRTVPLGLFLLDQSAHLVVLLVAWAVFMGWMGPPDPLISEAAMGTFATAAIVAAAFAFNAVGGAAVVSGVLAAHDPTLEGDAGGDDRTQDPGVRGSGRLIGILERTLILILILGSEWAAIVILIAAKSIARFDELKGRRFSEYFLIGTLTSLLVAVLTGLMLQALL
jgi:hypothetical protein